MNSVASYKLSETQIQRLIDFTHQKYVQYDDVKIEIVDHLASDIEALITKNRELDFETALKRTYSKFPITGFAQFIDVREEALHKIWGKKMNKVIRSYFKPPKLLLTAIIFVCTFTLGVWNPLHFQQIDLWFFVITFIPLSILYVYAFVTNKFPTKYFTRKPVNLLLLKIYQARVTGLLVLPIILLIEYWLLKSIYPRPTEFISYVNMVWSAIYSAVYAYLFVTIYACLLYTSPSPRDATLSRMPSSA